MLFQQENLLSNKYNLRGLDMLQTLQMFKTLRLHLGERLQMHKLRKAL